MDTKIKLLAITIGIFIGILAVNIPICFSFTVRIDSPKVRVSALPGSSKSGIITVENPKNEPINVHAYINDWLYNPGGDGTKTFYPAGMAPLSCAKWLFIQPEDFTLPAFGKAEVGYTVTVPKDALGGHYAVIFFETLAAAPPDQQGVTAAIAARIASLIYVEAEDTIARKGEIAKFTASPAGADKPFDIDIEFKNTGNIDIISKGTFEILDSNNNIAGRGEIPDMYTLSGDTASAKATWLEGLKPGQYTLMLNLDLGKDEFIIKELPVKVE